MKLWKQNQLVVAQKVNSLLEQVPTEANHHDEIDLLIFLIGR